MTIKEFVASVNNKRRENKNKWYFWKGQVNGKKVQIKAYKTWVQIIKYQSKYGYEVTHRSPMGLKVGDFKKFLEKIQV